MKTAKCPFCTKTVSLSKKNCILSHLVSTGVKCVGIGYELKGTMLDKDYKSPIKKKPRRKNA